MLQKVRSYNRGFNKYTLGKAPSLKILERELQYLESEFDELNPKKKARMARVILSLFYNSVLEESNTPKCARLLHLLSTLNIKDVKSELDSCKVMLRFATSVPCAELSNEVQQRHKDWSYETVQFFEQIA